MPCTCGTSVKAPCHIRVLKSPWWLLLRFVFFQQVKTFLHGLFLSQAESKLHRFTVTDSGSVEESYQEARRFGLYIESMQKPSNPGFEFQPYQVSSECQKIGLWLSISQVPLLPVHSHNYQVWPTRLETWNVYLVNGKSLSNLQEKSRRWCWYRQGLRRKRPRAARRCQHSTNWTQG